MNVFQLTFRNFAFFIPCANNKNGVGALCKNRRPTVMKHVFVINPCAGGKDRSDDIAAELDIIGLDAEIHTTTAPRDATRFVARWLADHPGEGVRFYACGGDGTLNEVVSGAVGADCEVTCYPCGSGNDYVKYFEGTDFTDLEALTQASSVEVDVMRVGDRYCINTLNFGFEAEVCRTMADVRRVPVIGGRMAYTTGIVKSLATGRRNPCRIMADGEPWFEGDLLLASLANGRYAGGGYKCAPWAENDDGLMELMSIQPMSIARFAKMIGHYERGEHLDMPELHDVIRHRRTAHVTIESEHPFFIATDGELLEGTRFDVECLHKALRFAVPAKTLTTNT